jgi:hypothetical protein
MLQLIDSEASKAPDQASWSQVVSKRQPHSHRDTLQHSVVTAVYIDQSIKKSRKACVIITGLAPVATKSDTELFTSMCLSEFHIQPIISSVKRLGRQLVGKTQLLVTLKQTDQAKQLIGSAKQLRQSSDPTTREKVYINPYLTRAEAAAAYQIRVQRRSAHQHIDWNTPTVQRAPTSTTATTSTTTPIVFKTSLRQTLDDLCSTRWPTTSNRLQRQLLHKRTD